MTRKIVVDENIPYGREAFGTLSEVRTMAGRAITPVDLRDAEILCVRSITKVNADLLAGTAVRFVATATIGVDHIDLPYLRSRGIAFASAPGSNANSVAEYITAALLVMADRRAMELAGKTLGIVGVGNVGSRVAAKAAALGMRTILNDPPLARETGEAKYRPIEELQAEADIVTLHVPLTKTGPDATFHLADTAFIERLKPGAILMNTSRGGVADTGALTAAIGAGRLGGCVLDVWENEPNIDPALLERVDIASPHVAGYSFDGKVKGTQMIYEAACRFAGVEPTFDPTPLLPPPDVDEIDYSGADDNITEQQMFYDSVLIVYDILADDADMRDLLLKPPGSRGDCFDSLRKNYRQRREFNHTHVVLPEGSDARVGFGGLGFDV